MNNETIDLMEKLIKLAEDINTFVFMKNNINNNDANMGIIPSNTEDQNIKFLKLSSYTNLKDIISSNIDIELSKLLVEYNKYESALKVNYPEQTLYEIINRYINYTNNSKSISNILYILENSKDRLNFKINIEIENNNGKIIEMPLVLNRKHEQVNISENITGVIQGTSAFLDDVSYGILSNLDKVSEENEEVEKLPEESVEVIEPPKKKPRRKKTTTE